METLKEEKYSRWGSAIFSIIIFIGVFAYLYFTDESNFVERYTMAEYRSSAIDLNYRDALTEKIALNTPIIFRGEVIQTIDRMTFRVMTAGELFGDTMFYSGDTVYVEFDSPVDIINGDIVEIYAAYGGILTYDSLIGTVNVPALHGDHYSIITPQ